MVSYLFWCRIVFFYAWRCRSGFPMLSVCFNSLTVRRLYRLMFAKSRQHTYLLFIYWNKTINLRSENEIALIEITFLFRLKWVRGKENWLLFYYCSSILPTLNKWFQIHKQRSEIENDSLVFKSEEKQCSEKGARGQLLIYSFVCRSVFLKTARWKWNRFK